MLISTIIHDIKRKKRKKKNIYIYKTLIWLLILYLKFPDQEYHSMIDFKWILRLSLEEYKSQVCCLSKHLYNSHLSGEN